MKKKLFKFEDDGKFSSGNPSILKKSWSMIKIKNSYYAYMPSDKILKEVISVVKNQIDDIVNDLKNVIENKSISDNEEEETEEECEQKKDMEEEENEFEEVEDEMENIEKVEMIEINKEEIIDASQNEFIVTHGDKTLFKKSLNEDEFEGFEYINENEYLEVNNYLEMGDNSQNENLQKENKKEIVKTENKLVKRRKRVERPVHSCPECSFTCGREKFMRIHLLKEHNISNRKFKCSDCDQSFDQNCILKAHYIRKHTNNYPFTCHLCGKQYKVKGDLSNHVRLYHEEKSLICDICGKSCSNSNSLYTHKKRIHYRPDFDCLLCKRAFVTQENLDRHLISQHSRYVCEECGKTFATKVILQRHISSVHENIRLHNCQFCSRSFARHSHLRQHLLIHTGKRLFACDLCDKTFTQKPGLISHRKLHPGDHPPLPIFRLDDALSDLIPK